MDVSTKKTPVINPGVDDMIAILLALASPELEILAFIVTFGNTDRDACYDNILKLYQLLARHFETHPSDKSRFPNFDQERKTILVRGADAPLEGELHRATYFHGKDGLSNISIHHREFDLAFDFKQDHPQLEITSKPCVDTALDLIRDYPRKSITYIALGPLTSLAQIAHKDAALVHDRIGRVICMGGALDVPGNVSPVAEFNFYADPFAVRTLLHPGGGGKTLLPLGRFLLASLDITTEHALPFAVYEKLVDSSFCKSLEPPGQTGNLPLTRFTSAFLERTRTVMLGLGKDEMELHDIVAVWCAIDNPPTSGLSDGWMVMPRKFDIERTGELTRGMLVIDKRTDTTAYAPGANRSKLQAELDRRSIQHGIFESSALPVLMEVEGVAGTNAKGPGVLCITKTPGSAQLLRLLLERVWGVTHGA